jgi:hypothetical protein
VTTTLTLSLHLIRYYPNNNLNTQTTSTTTVSTSVKRLRVGEDSLHSSQQQDLFSNNMATSSSSTTSTTAQNPSMDIVDDWKQIPISKEFLRDEVKMSFTSENSVNTFVKNVAQVGCVTAANLYSVATRVARNGEPTDVPDDFIVAAKLSPMQYVSLYDWGKLVLSPLPSSFN